MYLGAYQKLKYNSWKHKQLKFSLDILLDSRTPVDFCPLKDFFSMLGKESWVFVDPTDSLKAQWEWLTGDMLKKAIETTEYKKVVQS